MTTAWYKITAYNTQARYGYGSEAEAAKLCEILNSGREINVYSFEVVEDAEEIARLESDQVWANLEDELAAIDAE